MMRRCPGCPSPSFARHWPQIRSCAASTLDRGAVAILERLFGELGGVDLVIISAATGHNNAAMHGDLDVAT
jgi:hypothetical protein